MHKFNKHMRLLDNAIAIKSILMGMKSSLGSVYKIIFLFLGKSVLLETILKQIFL